jgi:hypothetical protein
MADQTVNGNGQLVRAVHHDPDVCGIDYTSSCDACRAHMWPAPTPTDWGRLCERYPLLARASGWPLREVRPPRPYSEPEVAKLVSTLHAPAYRDLLRDMLADLLAEDIADIALAIVRGNNHAP